MRFSHLLVLNHESTIRQIGITTNDGNKNMTKKEFKEMFEHADYRKKYSDTARMLLKALRALERSERKIKDLEKGIDLHVLSQGMK
jgi:hypothetical protein